MKRKRDWLALIDYRDNNIGNRIRQMMQFSFNPKTLSGLAKLTSVMETQNHTFISAEIFRKGHR